MLKVSRIVTVLYASATLVMISSATVKAADSVAQEGAAYSNRASDLSNWTASAGAAVASAPVYEGSNKTEISVIPVIDVQYKDGLFFAGTDGIGMTPFASEQGNISVALGYDMGRQEKDDRKNLRGLGDVDGSVLGMVSGEYNVGPATFSTTASSGLGGDYGTTAEFGVGSGYAVTENLSFGADIHTEWADASHMENFFGVTDKQAARSGKKKFAADSGFKSYGVGVNANYAVTPEWGVFSGVNANQLIGDAADSPVSKDDLQVSGMVGVVYKFWGAGPTE